MSVLFLTVKELSRELNVPQSTIYYWLSIHAEFPVHRVGKHCRFVLIEVLAFWKDRNQPKCCADPLAELKELRLNRSLKTKTVNRVGLRTKGDEHGNY
jgi:excisionase family DNA binding protein